MKIKLSWEKTVYMGVNQFIMYLMRNYWEPGTVQKVIQITMAISIIQCIHILKDKTD